LQRWGSPWTIQGSAGTVAATRMEVEHVSRGFPDNRDLSEQLERGGNALRRFLARFQSQGKSFQH
ncbi:hypothetical protein A9T48_25440, partial [Salmonella enterica subsp. enterica serovar Kentucky]|nr:hypothetical protein [Salmonella enterica subsp. enterica serovar Kentucky]